jgi:hypothetical protein
LPPSGKKKRLKSSKNVIPRILKSLCFSARHQWLIPVILATQEAETRRINVRSQQGQTVPQDPISKNPSKNRAGRVAQSEGPEFKPQYWEKKKQNSLCFPFLQYEKVIDN